MLRRLRDRLKGRPSISPRVRLSVAMQNIRDRGLVAKHVIDVGAHHGFWSRRVAKVFPEAHFTLFEPQAEMGPHLDRFCASVAHARWFQQGVGGSMGTKALTVRPDDDTASSFLEDPDDVARRGWEQRDVDIVTLDHVCEHVIGAIPEIVKLDAEGMEPAIMEGARTLIGKTELFLLETPFFDPRPGNPDFLGTIQLMNDYGYAPYDITEVVPRAHDGAIGLCEMVFARQDGILRAFRGWDRQAGR